MIWLAAAGEAVKRIPWQAWAALLVAALLAGVWLHGRSAGKTACEARYARAEAKADAKGERVAKRAQGEAREAQRGMDKEKVTNERIRTVIQRVSCDPLPDGVRDDVQRKLEAARGRVPAD